MSCDAGPLIHLDELDITFDPDLGGYETWLGTNRVEREASVRITEKIMELFGRVR